MSNFSWIIFSNKMANSLMVVGVCCYLVRVYLHPFIKKTMDKRSLFFIDLKNSVISQKEENKILLSAIKAQEAHTVQLLAKMRVWAEVLEQKQTIFCKEESLQAQRLLLYLQKRADGLCQERLKNETFSRVYEKTYQQVTDHFKDKDAHTLYVQTLIAGLAKGDSRG